jgi:hypothetical protein
MSGIASPPPAASAPSAARADDLFALAKFVQSEDAQKRLAELQEAECRAFERLNEAELATAAAKKKTTELQGRVDTHTVAVKAFQEESAAHYIRLTQRETAVAARERVVLEREDRCTAREREHQAVVAGAEAEATQREARFSQRERELDARINAHEADRSALERRRNAMDQAMRS